MVPKYSQFSQHSGRGTVKLSYRLFNWTTVLIALHKHGRGIDSLTGECGGVTPPFILLVLDIFLVDTHVTHQTILKKMKCQLAATWKCVSNTPYFSSVGQKKKKLSLTLAPGLLFAFLPLTGFYFIYIYVPFNFRVKAQEGELWSVLRSPMDAGC